MVTIVGMDLRNASVCAVCLFADPNSTAVDTDMAMALEDCTVGMMRMHWVEMGMTSL